jgi:predicted dehydrogenase
MVYLMGAPESMCYFREPGGAGAAHFTFPGGSLASIAFTHGSSHNGGMERTQLFSKKHAGHITVENNVKVTFHRTPPGLPYGASPSFYTGDASETSAVWEPEFSLGQLYNKGLFLLGYYGEIEAFAQAVLPGSPLKKAGLDDAVVITKIFEAFAEGPGRVIKI